MGRSVVRYIDMIVASSSSNSFDDHESLGADHE